MLGGLMKKRLASLIICASLLFSPACAPETKQKIHDTMVSIGEIAAPIIVDAQIALKNIQQNYVFWAALVQGTLQVAGVTLTTEQINAAKPVIAAMDAALVPLGSVANNEKVDPIAVQTAVIAVQNAVPTLTQKALANPAVNMLYQAYMSGQTNVPKPTT
jgi:hypothetical protein